MNNENNQIKQENNTMQTGNVVRNSKKSNPKTNAITALVFDFISLFIFGWLSVAGLSLSIIALKGFKESNEKGKGLAIAGIIVSIICMALYFTSIVLKSIHS